jgi:hypothetical protein
MRYDTMARTVLMLLIMIAGLSSPPQAQTTTPDRKPGVAGCHGPQIDLLNVKICDLDPGRSIRAFCTDGSTIDIILHNGNAQVPDSCTKSR